MHTSRNIHGTKERDKLMLKIENMRDVNEVRKKGLLQDAYIEEVERYFKELCESLTGQEDAWKNHSMEQSGSILILQNPVDIEQLEDYGIEGWGTDEAAVFPEFCTIVRLENEGVSFRLIKVFVLLNNECMLVMYIEEGLLDEGVEKWLKEFVI